MAHLATLRLQTKLGDPLNGPRPVTRHQITPVTKNQPILIQQEEQHLNLQLFLSGGNSDVRWKKDCWTVTAPSQSVCAQRVL